MSEVYTDLEVGQVKITPDEIKSITLNNGMMIPLEKVDLILLKSGEEDFFKKLKNINIDNVGYSFPGVNTRGWNVSW